MRGPIATRFLWNGYIADLMNERSFDSQATRVINVYGLFSLHLSMAFYTTRHWQTSGRLVQKLNICTVGGPS